MPGETCLGLSSAPGDHSTSRDIERGSKASGMVRPDPDSPSFTGRSELRLATYRTQNRLCCLKNGGFRKVGSAES